MSALEQAISSGNNASIKEAIKQLSGIDGDFELLLSLLGSDDDWIVFDVCNLVERAAKRSASVLAGQKFVEYLLLGLRTNNGKVLKMTFSVLTHWTTKKETAFLAQNGELLAELTRFYIENANGEMAFDMLRLLFKEDTQITTTIIDNSLVMNPADEFQALRILRLYSVALANEIQHKRKEMVDEFGKFIDESFNLGDELVFINVIEIISEGCVNSSAFEAFLSGNIVERIAHGLLHESESIVICALNFFIQCSSIEERCIFAVGKFVSLPPNFEQLFHECPFYPKLIVEIIDLANGGAGNERIAAFYSMCNYFNKPFEFSGGAVFQESFSKIEVSTLVANCKCFNNEQAEAANAMLLAILSTSVGLQWFLKEGSVQRYVLDDGYNPNLVDILEYLDNNNNAIQMLPENIKSRVTAVRKGSKTMARAAVGSEFK